MSKIFLRYCDLCHKTPNGIKLNLVKVTSDKFNVHDCKLRVLCDTCLKKFKRCQTCSKYASLYCIVCKNMFCAECVTIFTPFVLIRNLQKMTFACDKDYDKVSLLVMANGGRENPLQFIG